MLKPLGELCGGVYDAPSGFDPLPTGVDSMNWTSVLQMAILDVFQTAKKKKK